MQNGETMHFKLSETLRAARSMARWITKGGVRPPAAAAALKSPLEKPLVVEPVHATERTIY